MNPGPKPGHAPAGSAIWRGNSDDRSRQALVGRPARIASSSRQKMRRNGAMPASDLPSSSSLRSTLAPCPMAAT
jgi:hypothetical protein